MIGALAYTPPFSTFCCWLIKCTGKGQKNLLDQTPHLFNDWMNSEQCLLMSTDDIHICVSPIVQRDLRAAGSALFMNGNIFFRPS